MMRLFSFWRSLATCRVRIALNLKGLTPDDEIDIDLIKRAQHEAACRVVNPMMALPTLIDGEAPALFESLAIIEYLNIFTKHAPTRRCYRRMRAAGRGRVASPRSWRVIVIRSSCRASASTWRTNLRSRSPPVWRGAATGIRKR
jgi:glutathione S-transferase